MTEKSYIKAEHSGPLQGEVQVSGTKNMVSKVIAASLSADEGTVRIRNIPFVGDLAITLALCRRLGVNYQLDPSKKELELSVGDFTNPDVISDPYHGNRVAILFAGPVLAKLGRANISKPEGCQIGERKIDYHLQGLKAFGVNITDKGNYYSLSLKKTTLEGTRYDLPFPSVGATENLLITASCAEGVSILNNCALEPEIIELVKILQRSGVDIKTFPDRTLKIVGRKHGITPLIDVIPDRVEAASLAIAALASRGDVFIHGAQHEPLISFLDVLQEMKAGFDIQDDGIRFYWREPLKAADITTEVYPGFPTDFQQPMAILMSQAEGRSSIHETIFEERFRYLDELNKIATLPTSLNISTACPAGLPCRFKDANYKHTAYINGPIGFGAGEIEITDMRAGFAAINAAIISSAEVTIRNLKGLYRGYENPVGKLKSLGAKIELVI
ncbi:hypothetical protein A2686_03700 [Candidatus Woesebacteria bacterium RIFCSPHIGHO2_01_FULL_38_10]|nr:MAG: hypothetical protein A2686_03700 [Candidatus Woesebacteria bacterium RIFCSPHIGHO2_01_FULL_38_10]